MRPTRILLAAVGVSALLAAMPASAQSERETFHPLFGRSDVAIPLPTDDGVWGGTWFYVNRDIRMALWIRPGEDHPKVKVQFLRSGLHERFTTDWDGHVEFKAEGAPGIFTLGVTDGDDNRISATWDWDLQFADSGRTEKGTVQIYRTGDGRLMVFMFEDVERKIRRGQRFQEYPLNQVWTFRKASKREVLWDELPF